MRREVLRKWSEKYMEEEESSFKDVNREDNSLSRGTKQGQRSGCRGFPPRENCSDQHD